MNTAMTETPIPIRSAATVLICRDGAAGPEVLMMQRHALSDVHGGSYVFPGGKVDASDAQLDPAAHLDEPPERLHALLAEPAINAATAAAIHVAAVREVFEECGLLLAEGLDGPGALEATALGAQGVSFNDMLARLGLRLATRAMRPWSRWITPPQALHSPGKRFDTRFFIARAPAGQEPLHDAHEAVLCAWMRPHDALERYWRGDIVLAGPQIMSLAHLSRHASVGSMMAEAECRAPCVVRPLTFDIDGHRAVAYPGDPLHPERSRVMPGPLRLVLRGKRLEPPGGFDDLWQ
ncbi:NUDIX domain protein [Variovorax sp. PBS-H4]|uniref:NUDIX hydrolase n=1 Tax=Variovorax sp. PBS-H4 TaxID=434008 RepID=UPI001316A51E|nr:NUDIX domain-containing protein [Variovorax sp. PBS-H4]VTU40171.1 NUDIX domain protein [Variovorax sp. PBS-H4]